MMNKNSILKNRNFILLVLLILLNVVLRLPITPHGTGSDSFMFHELSNSIIQYGYAKWVIHPASIFGLYPYSYPSGLMYLLASISLLTNLSMENVSILFPMFLGVLGVFGAYLVAGEIKKNFLFQFLVAFSF